MSGLRERAHPHRAPACPNAAEVRQYYPDPDDNPDTPRPLGGVSSRTSTRSGDRPVRAGRTTDTLHQEKPMPANVLTPPWSITRRILFRFGFTYLALYTLPMLL